MAGGSALLEEYSNLPGFGDSLGASGFFDFVGDDDICNTDDETKGMRVALCKTPVSKSSLPSVSVEVDNDIPSTTTDKRRGLKKKPSSTRQSLNRKTKSLRSVSHKVNQVLLEMDHRDGDSQQQPQPTTQTQAQAQTQTQAQKVPSTKRNLRKQGSSTSVSSLSDISEISKASSSATKEDANKTIKEPRTPRESKRRSAANPPLTTALTPLCEGSSIPVDSKRTATVGKASEDREATQQRGSSPATPKSRKSRLSAKSSLRDIAVTRLESEEESNPFKVLTSFAGPPKKKLTPNKQKSHLVNDFDGTADNKGETPEGISSATATTRTRRKASCSRKSPLRDRAESKSEDEGESNPSTVSTSNAESPKKKRLSNKHKSQSLRDLGDRPTATEATTTVKASKKQSRRRTTNDMSVSEGGGKLRLDNPLARDLVTTITSPDYQTTATMSFAEGGKRLRLKVVKHSTARDQDDNTADKLAAHTTTKKSSRSSISRSEGGASRRRLDHTQKSEKNLKVAHDDSDSVGRRHPSKSSNRKIRQSSMSVSEGGLRSRSSEDIQKNSLSPPKGRSRRPFKKSDYDGMPALESIEEAATETPRSEPHKERAKKKSNSQLPLSVGSGDHKELSIYPSDNEGSVASRRPWKSKKSLSLRDLATMEGTPATTRTLPSRHLGKRANSLRSLRIGERTESSKKSSSQSISEGCARRQLDTKTQRSSRSTPEKNEARNSAGQSSFPVTFPSSDFGAVRDNEKHATESPRNRRKRLTKTTMSLPSLQQLLGGSKPAGADSTASTAESILLNSESSSDVNGCSVRQEPETTDPFSPVDSDEKTIASISTDVSRVASGRRGRRHSTVQSSSLAHRLQQIDTPIATVPFRRAQTELFSADNKKAVWVHRRLRALGIDEESGASEVKGSSPPRGS